MKMNAAQITGIVFVVVGIISFIVVAVSFDYEYYNSIKGLTFSYGDEIAYMEEELFTTWVYAIILLLGNVAIGIVIMTLGKILVTLQLIAKRKNNEQTIEVKSE